MKSIGSYARKCNADGHQCFSFLEVERGIWLAGWLAFKVTLCLVHRCFHLVWLGIWWWYGWVVVKLG